MSREKSTEHAMQKSGCGLGECAKDFAQGNFSADRSANAKQIATHQGPQSV